MYHSIKIQTGRMSPLYPYCLQVCGGAKNLYNAALFRCRQVMTAVRKDPSAWTSNEREVMEELGSKFLSPAVQSKYHKPGKGRDALGYGFLYTWMRSTNNPDYFSRLISMH